MGRRPVIVGATGQRAAQGDKHDGAPHDVGSTVGLSRTIAPRKIISPSTGRSPLTWPTAGVRLARLLTAVTTTISRLVKPLTRRVSNNASSFSVAAESF